MFDTQRGILNRPQEKIPSSLSLIQDLKGLEESYQEAYNIGWERLKELNLKDVAHKAGASYELRQEATLNLPYLGAIHTIVPSKSKIIREDGREISIFARILILHYLVRANGSLPEGEYITFREVPDGLIYYPNFIKRIIKPILLHFGERPERMIDLATENMGAVSIPRGDAGISIRPFPHIVAEILIWRGDNEFPSEATLLFDRSIIHYLSPEDIIVLCQEMVRQITPN